MEPRRSALSRGWNYPYLDLCERHGRIHRICNPVSFQRQDGSPLTMNNQYRTTPLIVVVFGPTIQPGCGIPIRKGDTASPSYDEIDDACQVNGITARALAGDGSHRRDSDTYSHRSGRSQPSCVWIPYPA